MSTNLKPLHSTLSTYETINNKQLSPLQLNQPVGFIIPTLAAIDPVLLEMS